jgi:hypothetical protein
MRKKSDDASMRQRLRQGDAQAREKNCQARSRFSLFVERFSLCQSVNALASSSCHSFHRSSALLLILKLDYKEKIEE